MGGVSVLNRPEPSISVTRRSAAVAFGCCWLAYMAANLCRVNFSSALEALAGHLSAPAEQVGAIGTAFFVAYAVGQLINGFYSARVCPVKFIALGLIGTIACNLTVACARSLPVVWIAWSLNGYFQSMFWSTIIRVLAYSTLPNWQAGVSIGIFTSIPVSYALSWSVLGALLDGGSAAPYFIVPALIALITLIVWLAGGRASVVRPARAERNMQPFSPLKALRQIARQGLTPLLAVCVFHGLVKEGIAFWFPLLLGDIAGNQSGVQPALLLIIPLSNLAGMLISRFLIGKWRNPANSLILVYAAMAVCAFGLIRVSSGALTLTAIGLISCLSYAANTVLLSYVPMRYTDKAIVSSFVGLLDFSSYVGAALSTYALSRVMSQSGFSGVPAIWGCCAALAAILIAAAGRFMARRHDRSVSSL